MPNRASISISRAGATVSRLAWCYVGSQGARDGAGTHMAAQVAPVVASEPDVKNGCVVRIRVA